MEKTCTKCGTTKPLDEFYNNPRGRHGRSAACKSCRYAQARIWQRNNKQKVNEYYRKWRTANPERAKEVQRASYIKTDGAKSAREWRKRNVEKVKAIRLKSYNKDLEKSRKYHREFKQKQRTDYGFVQKESASSQRWRKRNPEKQAALGHRADTVRLKRLKENGGRHTPEEWQTLKALCGFVCVRCGTPESIKPLETDHIAPVCDGGPSFIWNIQPVCRLCNRRKAHKHIDYRVTSKHLDEDQRQKLFIFLACRLLRRGALL